MKRDEAELKHPVIWEAVQQMARASDTEPTLDLRRLIEMVGVKQVMDQLGLKRVREEVGLKRVVEAVGPGEFVSQLTPEQREEFKRLLQG
jgi:hypothetical protein